MTLNENRHIQRLDFHEAMEHLTAETSLVFRLDSWISIRWALDIRLSLSNSNLHSVVFKAIVDLCI